MIVAFPRNRRGRAADRNGAGPELDRGTSHHISSLVGTSTTAAVPSLASSESNASRSMFIATPGWPDTRSQNLMAHRHSARVDPHDLRTALLKNKNEL